MRRARELADKPALIDGPSGRTLTYGQLDAGIQRMAVALAQRGFQKGDVLAIWSPNLPEYAVASLGGINTTLNSLYTPGEVSRQLIDSDAKYPVTVAPFLNSAQKAVVGTSVEEVFVIGEMPAASEVGGGESVPAATPFRALLAEDGPMPQVSIDPREDVVVLPYSSGTTGLPKGVMLTHRNLVANLVQLEALDLANEGEIVLGLLPMFHIYGILSFLSLTLYAGNTVVTLPRFELESFLGTLQDYRVTFAPLVPPIMLALAKHGLIDRYDLSALHWVNNGAAPLAEDVAEAVVRRLRCRLSNGYGLTETSPVTHINLGLASPTRPSSIGPAIPGTECKIIDLTTGAESGPNQPGELCVRGPQVMKGYLNRPEETAATRDRDGWLHTGDLAYADDQSWFYIVDRVKELIKYKGYQVAPAELEAVLVAHPAVADAAVIPSPDDEAGEVPKALVVLRGQATPDELMQFVAERVAPFKKLRRLEIVDSVPKLATGKVLRRALVERERARVAEAASEGVSLT